MIEEGTLRALKLKNNIKYKGLSVEKITLWPKVPLWFNKKNRMLTQGQICQD